MPDFPITQNWTVVAFKEGKTEFNEGAKGKLTKFYVDFVGDDQTEAPDVYWRRKEGNAPKINDKVYGTVSEGQYGYMFKTESKGGGGFGGGGNSAAKDAYWQAKEERDIAGVKRMGRAHAQEMAIRMVIATGDADELDLTDASLTGTYLNEVIKKLADWFEADVNRAG